MGCLSAEPSGLPPGSGSLGHNNPVVPRGNPESPCRGEAKRDSYLHQARRYPFGAEQLISMLREGRDGKKRRKLTRKNKMDAEARAITATDNG